MQVTTREIDMPADLLSLLPDRYPRSLVCWLREGRGFVGWGVAESAAFSGPGRFAEAASWWEALCADTETSGLLGVPGTGPVAFGTFTFAPSSASTSVLVVPSVVLGYDGERAWLTTVDDPAVVLRDSLAHALPSVTLTDGVVPADEWPGVVAAAVARLRAGELEKVVLARQVLAHLDGDLDARAPLSRLAFAYPDAWTYLVDGMLGATPELLVSRLGGRVRSRVLAGTVPHDGSPASMADAGARLLADPKLAHEHRVAAESVAASLGLPGPLPEPFVLPQRAFSHLATDLEAAASDRSALELAGRLHPSAAVGGRPTDRACEVIEELERADRGRYAGPVGWVDARGDGEWGIALRGGELLDDRTLRICVGGGIMAGSDPGTELAETDAKLAPMRTALGLDRF